MNTERVIISMIALSHHYPKVNPRLSFRSVKEGALLLQPHSLAQGSYQT